MLTALDDYDWAEAFGEGSGGNCTNNVEEAFGCPDTRFTREDVEEILYLDVTRGDYAETDCAGVFRLKDGRYAAVTASCDTTGWDCQAGNVITVAADIETICNMGVNQWVRDRLPAAVIEREKGRRGHPDNAPFATAMYSVNLAIADPQHPDLSPYATAL